MQSQGQSNRIGCVDLGNLHDQRVEFAALLILLPSCMVRCALGDERRVIAAGVLERVVVGEFEVLDDELANSASGFPRSVLNPCTWSVGASKELLTRPEVDVCSRLFNERGQRSRIRVLIEDARRAPPANDTCHLSIPQDVSYRDRSFDWFRKRSKRTPMVRLASVQIAENHPGVKRETYITDGVMVVMPSRS
jgi:hypothetical protein